MVASSEPHPPPKVFRGYAKLSGQWICDNKWWKYMDSLFQGGNRSVFQFFLKELRCDILGGNVKCMNLCPLLVCAHDKFMCRMCCRVCWETPDSGFRRCNVRTYACASFAIYLNTSQGGKSLIQRWDDYDRWLNILKKHSKVQHSDPKGRDSQHLSHRHESRRGPPPKQNIKRPLNLSATSLMFTVCGLNLME